MLPVCEAGERLLFSEVLPACEAEGVSPLPRREGLLSGRGCSLGQDVALVPVRWARAPPDGRVHELAVPLEEPLFVPSEVRASSSEGGRERLSCTWASH